MEVKTKPRRYVERLRLTPLDRVAIHADDLVTNEIHTMGPTAEGRQFIEALLRQSRRRTVRMLDECTPEQLEQLAGLLRAERHSVTDR